LPLAGVARAETGTAPSWNPLAAAAYLDRRAGWWMTWPTAARDQGTFCVSCHTAVPYALSRSALPTREGPASTYERSLLDNVAKRVRLWNDVKPFYTDEEDGEHKSAESRGTEAVLNALVLASHDARTGKNGDDTPAAFAHMWALQRKTGDDEGAWPWLRFDLEPWEAEDSAYYGAALAAVAVGMAPAADRSPAAREGRELLRRYLAREFAAQPAINRVAVLWAAARWPELLGPPAKAGLIEEILGQQQADGGWSLPSLVRPWKRSDGTPLETTSDGYATGLVAFALQQAGMPHDDARLERAFSWLVDHQDRAEGYWPSSSLNEKRDPSSDTGRFMSDAATAYSVLALTAR
jgi:squalene-hopene/tetraprenyl-beta-curcumene cyclase